MIVSLVRVENEWHVFSETRPAWDFYQEWKNYRDCEFRGECTVDASLEAHSWIGHATQTEANECALCRELPPEAKLMPGERWVDGEVQYSADWLSDNHVSEVSPRDYKSKYELTSIARRQERSARIGTSAERPGDKHEEDS